MNDKYRMFQPEDRGKCDRLWTTTIERIGQVAEELANEETAFAVICAMLAGGGAIQDQDKLMNMILETAKLKGELAYRYAQCDYYKAYIEFDMGRDHRERVEREMMEMRERGEE